MPLSDEDMYKVMGPTSMAPDEIGETKPVRSFYGWTNYRNRVNRLKELIDPKPDVIVSIGKGGSIPGVILAEYFKVDNYNLGLKSYNNFNQTKMIEYQPLPSYEGYRGKKVLLVDDLADSGETFKYALYKFKENKVENVKTASVFKKVHSKFTPDYFVDEIESNVWVVHPWEEESLKAWSISPSVTA
jgi:hypoxanthine phosphoribosyltransferase